MAGPEDKADVQGSTNVASAGRAGATRETIDDLLKKAGWHVFDLADADFGTLLGSTRRDFSLKTSHGVASYAETFITAREICDEQADCKR